MAAPSKQNPLDALQQLFSEALIETGKALKRSQKHGAQSVVGSGAGLHSPKMPKIMQDFQYTLDGIEHEITNAKAVLLRDLEKLQAARMPAPEPQSGTSSAPVIAEATQPAKGMINTPSSVNGSLPAKDEAKPVAPIPDMGMVIDISNDADVDLTSSANPITASPHIASTNTQLGTGARATPPFKPSPKPTPPQKKTPVATPQAPQQTAALPAQKGTPVQPPPANGPEPTAAISSGGTAATADMASGDYGHFTNMEFSLAPSSSEASQNVPTAQMADFGDMNFSTHDAMNTPSLDILNSGAQPSATPAAGNSATGTATAQTNQTDQSTAPATNADEIYNLDNMSGDVNMDLDMNFDDAAGMNDSAFNDIFYENNKELDQFDNAFFGIE